MSTRRRNLPKEKKKKKSAMSLVYLLIFIVAVVGIGWWFFSEFNYRNQYNNLVKELDNSLQNDNKQGIESSMKKFELMQGENASKPERVAVINESLIRCYSYFARDYGTALKVQIEYLQKLEKLAPNELSEQEKLLLKTKF